VMEDEDGYLDVQITGRAEAERFRASNVYPRLIRDALTDVDARGSDRRRE